MKHMLFVFLILFVANAEAKKLIVKYRFPPKATCVDDSNLSMLEGQYDVVQGVAFDGLAACTKSEELKKANAEVTVEREERIREFIAKFPKYKKFEADAIKFKVQIGMPEELVLLMWGTPSRTNEARSAASIRKQLVFGSILYVYTEKGFVVVVQWAGVK
jgi:hypothetical protein